MAKVHSKVFLSKELECLTVGCALHVGLGDSRCGGGEVGASVGGLVDLSPATHTCFQVSNRKAVAGAVFP